MKFQLTNQTDQSLYWTILGRKEVGGSFYWMKADGSFKEISTADNTSQSHGIKYANFSYSLAKTPIPEINETVISGRVYLSMGEALPIVVHGPSGYAGPSPTNPSVPGFDIVYDKFEFTFEPTSVGDVLWCNTTSVDFLGFPINATLQSSGESVGYDVCRNVLIDAFNALGDKGLIIRDPKKKNTTKPHGDVIRVLSPAQLKPSVQEAMKSYIPKAVFEVYESYWNESLTRAWKYYEAECCEITPYEITYYGQVSDGKFIFKRHDNNAVAYVMPRQPTSMEVFAGDGMMNQGNDTEKNIEKFIVAALLRGVFDRYSTSKEWCANKQDYYKQSPIFEYARILHEKSTNKRCYAFSYDDVCNDSSSLKSSKSDEVVMITVPCFTPAD